MQTAADRKTDGGKAEGVLMPLSTSWVLAGSLACPQTDDGSCTDRSTSCLHDNTMTDLSAQYIFTDWDFSPMASGRRPEHPGVNGLSPSSKEELAEHCTPHVLVPHPIPPFQPPYLLCAAGDEAKRSKHDYQQLGTAPMP